MWARTPGRRVRGSSAPSQPCIALLDTTRWGHTAALVLIPDDNPALAIAKYGVTALAGGVALTFFAGGFLVAALQEEV